MNKFVFKKALSFESIQIIMFVYIPFSFFSWNSISHLPEWSILWTVFSILFALMLSYYSTEKLVIDDNGIKYTKKRKQQFLKWNEIKNVNLNSNNTEQIITFESDTKLKTKINFSTDINDLKKFIQVINNKLDTTLAIESINLKFVYNIITRILFLSILVSLLLWTVIDSYIDYLHIFLLPIQSHLYYLIGLIVLLIALPYIIHKNKFLREKLGLILLLIGFSVIVGKGLLSSIIKLHNELNYYKYEDVGITAKLNRSTKSGYQNWNIQKISNKKVDINFKIDNWTGSNSNLKTATSYTISITRVGFGYGMVSKEQFHDIKVNKK